MSTQGANRRSPQSPPQTPKTQNFHHRIGRNIIRQPMDEHPSQSFGDPIYTKSPDSTRLFFQNVKGLTYSAHGNDATLESDKKFAQMLSECDLHDLHSSTPAPSTYMDACKRRIDFIFGCQQVVQSVIQQGTLSYYEGPQADHRGLYIDLDIHKLLSITMQTCQQPFSSRLLQSVNPELVQMYNTAVHKYYAEHRMLERLEHIRLLHQTYSRDKLRNLLESWDEDQGRAMLHAESTLRKPLQKS